MIKLPRRILVTAALPYSNGDLHLGHLCSTYLPADVFVRFHKLRGNDAIYICATDDHGSPIEFNALKAGIAPEKFIKKYWEQHEKDFKDVNVNFDIFYHTNTPENKSFAVLFFNKAKQKGLVYEKEVSLIYCPNCRRFLPDRYVKGTCPKCNAEEQYGDICEKCGIAYATTDLIEPRCSLCGKKPVEKKSTHYFFKLSALSSKLKAYIEKNNDLQADVKGYVLNWIKDGLKDWDVTRDGPYFGFNIPGEKDKYFYVWLDAPIGYVSSTFKWCSLKKKKFDDWWHSSKTEIYHFIGKDIVYFHYLFWPALLMTASFSLPKSIPTRGYLTIEKEKMSKSRGKYITARQYLNEFPADYLRYYFTISTPNNTADVDFSRADFISKVNSELSNTFGNFVHRTLTFIANNFDSAVPSIPKNHKLSRKDKEFQLKIKNIPNEVAKEFEKIELKRGLEKLMLFTGECNRYFDYKKPWKSIKDNIQDAGTTLNLCAKACATLSVLLEPIVPSTALKLQRILNIDLKRKKWDNAYKLISENAKINKPTTLIPKIETGEQKLEKKKEQEDEPKKAEVKPMISFEEFQKLDLRAAKVIDVRDHPQADKLYILDIDLGKEKRQIVAGVKACMSKKELKGKTIIVVANLEPAVLRGEKSEGMLLAAEEGEKVYLVTVEGKVQPGAKIR